MISSKRREPSTIKGKHKNTTNKSSLNNECECIDWSQDPPGSEERKETYRHEHQLVFRIHTRALDFLEQRWKEVKELSLLIPRQENKRKRLENLIRNNLICLLNTQANRILLTHTGKLIYTNMGITYAGNGTLMWKKRAIKSPHENLWPL